MDRLQSMGYNRAGHDLMTKQQQIYIQTNVIPIYLVYIYIHMHASSVAQLCPALCNPMDCSPPGSSVHGIFQARILECLPFSPPGDLPSPELEPASPALAGGCFTTAPPDKPIYPCTQIYIHVYIFMCTCVYTCICIHTCACVYVCIKSWLTLCL